MMDVKFYTLNDGSRIPAIGFGNHDAFGSEEIMAIRCAIETGYRYLDSATRYNNEPEIGEALQAAMKDAIVQRESLYLLSKVWPSDYENVERALIKTLRELQVDRLDAYLLHWPTTSESRRFSAYEQCMKLREKGLLKTIGVSNFSVEQIKGIHQEFGEYPAINQIESHPMFQERELVDGCQALGVQVIDYRPINRGAYLNNADIKAIAAKHGKTNTQVVLRWHVDHNQIPIPKSTTPSRIAENFAIFDFNLTPDEVAIIDALETGKRAGSQSPESFNGENWSNTYTE